MVGRRWRFRTAACRSNPFSRHRSASVFRSVLSSSLRLTPGGRPRVASTDFEWRCDDEPVGRFEGGMREIERRMTVLYDDEEMTAEERSQWDAGIVAYLRDRPELDGPFLNRYITKPVDELDRMAGLGILAYLGRQRPFDHKPLMSLIERRGGDSTELREAAFCVAQLANSLDVGELLRLTEIMPEEDRVSAYCKLIDALATMTDRGKAMQ